MHLHKGFTLIEFVVIISIFAIMAGIGIFNFRGFQTDVSVNNLAHDVAVSIRKVQAESSAALSGEFNPFDPTATNPVWRGIYFPADAGGTNEQRFVIFNDMDENGVYSDIGGDSLVEEIVLQTEDTIARVDYQTSSNVGSSTWNTFSGGSGLVFKRPFPEVVAWGDENGSATDISLFRIVLSNKDTTECKAVVVSKIGEISIDRKPYVQGVCDT